MIRILIPLLLLPTVAMAAPKKDPYATIPLAETPKMLAKKLSDTKTDTKALIVICDDKVCAIININGDEK